MENKTTKIHFDNKVFLTLFLIFLVGATLLGFNRYRGDNCDVVDFTIIASSKTTSDLIEFKSTGKNNYEWEWDFGDNTDKEFVSNTIHQYEKEGIYTVILKVNNNCIASQKIKIRKEQIRERIIEGSIPKIVFPTEVTQGKMASFECTSDFANKWEWRFGETQKVDAITANANYTFKKEGFHKILLITNDDLKHVLVKEIMVLPKKQTRTPRNDTPRTDRIADIFNQIPDEPIERASVPVAEITPELVVQPKPDPKPETPKIVFSKRDAITMLNNYAAGKIDYVDIANNFCNDNIKVKGKKNTNTNLKNMLSQIRGKDLDIKNITLLKNSKTGCVKFIHIDMKLKKGMFWKQY